MAQTTETTKTAETAETDLRTQYRWIGARSGVDPKTFNQAVIEILAGAGVTEPTPAQFVKGARAVSFPCRRCAGTGQYITKVVNGKPTGPGGICYRCGGKGRQNDADRRRNYGYDVRGAVAAAHAMGV
jgi:DnaJ-class molecular chaperone